MEPSVGGDDARRPLDAVWATICVALPVFVALVAGLRAIDLAYHLRLGAAIVDGAGIPRHDTLSFIAAGLPWTDQQWLGQAVLAAVDRFGGWEALLLLRAALTGSAFGLIYLAGRGRGAAPRTASLLAIGAYVAAFPALALRPQLFGVTAFAAALWASATRARAPWRAWILPVLALLVANVHGSFPLLVLVALLDVAEDASARSPIRRSMLVAVATIGATLLNPFGPDVWRYVVDLSRNPTIRSLVQEWRPITLGTYLGTAFLLTLAGVVALAWRRRRRVRPLDIVWLALFAVPALLAQRAVVWWALVAAVTAAAWLPAGVREVRATDGERRVATAILAGLGVLVVLALPWVRGGVPIRDVPEGLTTALRTLPADARLVVHQPWASWVEYATGQPVAVDSRIEVFPPEVWDDYLEVVDGGPAWKEVLERWRPDAIVADPETWKLVPLLREDLGWEVADEGDGWVVFVPA